MTDEFNKRSKKPPSDVVIFLDIDGVLADFEKHLHEKGKANEKGQPKWDELDHEWWTGIPVIPGAKKFHSELKQMGPVKFLSAPVPIVDSFSGKAEWLSHTFFKMPQGRFALLDLILCAGKDKKYLAGPNRILVDDRQKNIDEWVEAGGIGVHHKGDFNETLTAVKVAIATFRQKASVTPQAQVLQP